LDGNTYTLTVSAWYTNERPCPATQTATYTYLNCLTASFIWGAPTIGSLITSVKVQDAFGNPVWVTLTVPSVIDSISQAYSTTGLCGPIVFEITDITTTTGVQLLTTTPVSTAEMTID